MRYCLLLAAVSVALTLTAMRAAAAPASAPSAPWGSAGSWTPSREDIDRAMTVMLQPARGRVWNAVLDMGRTEIFFNDLQDCPWGAEYGKPAFILLPGAPDPNSAKTSSTFACLDLARVNARYTNFWVYLPDGSPAADGMVGGGVGWDGHVFEIRHFDTPRELTRPAVNWWVEDSMKIWLKTRVGLHLPLPGARGTSTH